MDPYESMFDSDHSGSLSNSERGAMEDFMVHEHNMINGQSGDSRDTGSGFQSFGGKWDKGMEKQFFRVLVIGIVCVIAGLICLTADKKSPVYSLGQAAIAASVLMGVIDIGILLS